MNTKITLATLLLAVCIVTIFSGVSTSITPARDSKQRSFALKQTISTKDLPTTLEDTAHDYHISHDKSTGLFQIPNRKHHIESFNKSGVWQLKNSETHAGSKWKLVMETEAVLADDKMLNSNVNMDTDVVCKDGQLDFKGHDYTEQFVNNSDGIRQNFIVHSAAPGTHQLKVVLKYKGMQAHSDVAGQIIFTAENTKLLYSDLKVWDALGTPLSASMKLDQEQQSIVLTAMVDDAQFPVIIDPLVANGVPGNANTILDFGQISAGFGVSVSGAGDVNGDGYGDVIVGAPYYDNGETGEGAAFVFHGSSAGINTVAADTFEFNMANAQVGSEVCGAGDINADGYGDVLIAAHQFSDGHVNEGAVYILFGSASGISTMGGIIISSNQDNCFFGSSISAAGDVNGDGYGDVLLGASSATNGQTDEGTVHVYYGAAFGVNGYDLLQSNQAFAFFGNSVSGAGDLNGDGYSDIAIASHWYNNGQTDEGVVFIYYGTAGGINPVAGLLLEQNQTNGHFGSSVAGAGDINGDGYSDLIVGQSDFDNGQFYEGAIYTYHGSAAGLNPAVQTFIQSNVDDAHLGNSVACAGDVNGDGYSDVIAGAYYYANGQTDEGMAFVYFGSAAGMNVNAASSIQSNENGASLGSCVKSAGDVNGDGYSDIVVGAPYLDNGQLDEGCALIYHGGAESIKGNSGLWVQSNIEYANFGAAVNSAGDVNGDGYNDLIVGAPFYTNGESDEGAAFIFHGSATGINFIPAAIIENNMGGEQAGTSVASAGDVNGDGYDDVIVGAPNYSNGEANEGAARIYYGSALGIITTPAVVLESNQATSGFGYSVNTAGDVNNDGYGDVIVGAYSYSNGQVEEGVAMIYHGSAAGINMIPAALLEHNVMNEYFGTSVATAGDVNGDGYSDVIVSSIFYSNGEVAEGGAFVFHGSAAGINPVPSIILESNQANARFGCSLSSAGDMNGDGYSDVIVGANLYDYANVDDGVAIVYAGSALGVDPGIMGVLSNNEGNAWFGYSVSSAGDVNGDGYSDVIVGSPQYANGQLNEGAMYIHHGSPVTGVNVFPAFVLELNQLGNKLGTAVCGAGDLNGDGFSDVISGSPQSSGPQIQEGFAYIHYGNGAKGLARNMQIFNAASNTPIQQSNINDDEFAVGVYCRSAYGRTKAKLVWEVKDESQPFSSGTEITNSVQFTAEQASYVNLGIAGNQLNNDIMKAGIKSKVRVRIKYDPVTALYGQVYGPWFYPQGYFKNQGMNASPSYDNNTPLPLQLISFIAEKNNGDALLQWSVIELNMNGYDVEHSTDLKQWSSITSVDALNVGNGSASNYLSNHLKPSPQLHYYRLRMNDHNGSVQYSDVRTLDFSETATLSIYPNPVVAGSLHIESPAASTYDILSLDGKVIKQGTLMQGSNVVEVHALSAGMYLLKSENSSVKFAVK